MREQVPIELAAHLNNAGITPASDTGRGRFNVWRNSLPGEELPLGRPVTAGGVRFAFPAAGPGRPDNVRCEGQLVTVPPGRYDWCCLLAAGERRVEDEVALHFADGSVDFEPVRVSDFWAASAVFGEDEAVATSVMHYPQHVQPGVTAHIWCQRVPVTRRAELRRLRLPHNVALHVFAATLCPSREEVNAG
ncbi:hypothetical protein ABGB07_22820 [Micromonosporaceae bacterium B7E4]